MNYRTIVSFGEKNIDFLLKKYNDLLLIPNRKGVVKAHISGLFFGYSQFIRFAFVGLVFWIAAILINKYNLDQQRTFTGVYVIFVGGIGAGVAISNLPSISKA